MAPQQVQPLALEQVVDASMRTNNNNNIDSEATMPVSVLYSSGMKPGHSTIPYVGLLSFNPASPQEPDILLETQAQEEQQKLKDGYKQLTDKVTKLIAYQQSRQTTTSPTLIASACQVSLHSRIPQILKQLAELIDKAQHESSLVRRLRASFALIRAVQYVERIQEGLDPESNDGLEQQLARVLLGLDTANLPTDFAKRLAFRVSPWVPSDLYFDLPVGDPATRIVEASESSSSLPIRVEVEPVVEFRADDEASVGAARRAASACRVTIVSCKHVARTVRSGAGMIGEAKIQVRVSPMAGAAESRVWRQGATPSQSTRTILIREARAVQLNSYQAKPKCSVDLYKTYVHGDCGVTVTMVIKTCETSPPHEMPSLHIELFVAK